MGHHLAGDLPSGQFRRFDRFPILTWLVGVGESVAVPRFTWVSAEGVDDSTPFLADLDARLDASWLAVDTEDDRLLRVPTYVDPVWFAKAAKPALTALARRDGRKRRGRLVLSMTFGFRLHASEQAGALARVNEKLARRDLPAIAFEDLNAFALDAPWDSLRRVLGARLDALDAPDEPRELLLLFCLGYMASTGAASAFVDDDDTAHTLGDFVKRRFFRPDGTRASEEAATLRCTAKLFAALEGNRLDEAKAQLATATMCASGLAEASPATAAVYVGAASLMGRMEALEQARADLAWADHLSGGRYEGAYREHADAVRAALDDDRGTGGEKLLRKIE